MSINDQFTDEESAFVRAFSLSATCCSIECDCGRVYFVSCRGHGDYEEGELERLHSLAASKPDKYFECWAFDSIDSLAIGGGQLIVQCQCGRARRYIDWLERYADNIASYLAIRLEQENGELLARLQRVRHHQAKVSEFERSRSADHFKGSGI